MGLSMGGKDAMGTGKGEDQTPGLASQALETHMGEVNPHSI